MTDQIPHGNRHPELSDELLDRYWLGEVSELEREYIQAWLSEHSRYNRDITALYAGIRTGRWVSLNAREKEIAKGSILASIRSEHSTGTAVRSSLVSKRFSWRHVITTAIVSVAICIAAIWNVFEAEYDHSSDINYVYSTSRGERATVSLPDGSRVILNVDSRLEVPTDFNVGNRNLTLQGEAVFDVSHTTSAPFVVSTRLSQTKVLGTTFIVRDYLDDSLASIAVQEGRVEVSGRVPGSGERAVLSANDQIDVSSSTLNEIATLQSERFSFVSGVLTFSGTPLGEAIGDLNRWYNTNILLADSVLANLELVGGFRLGSITDLVTILEMTNEVLVKREGQTLIIQKRG